MATAVNTDWISGLLPNKMCIPARMQPLRRQTIFVITVIMCTPMIALAMPAAAFADEARDQQWYLDYLGIEKTHKLSKGEGVTIGVVDGGVDATHPDLEGNVKAGKDYGTSTGNGLNDSDGHGTSTTSIIVGHGHSKNDSSGILGVAPESKVVSVGIDSDPGKFDIEWLGDSIKWLVDEGVDIISVTTVSAVAPVDTGNAIKYATEKGVPVVSPVGNDEPEYDDILGEIDGSKTTLWPAQASGAIPVTGSTRDGTFWDKSLTLKDAAPQPQLGLCAPAEALTTAEKGGGYATHSGTSGSAPIVAGTLALIRSAYPDLTYNQWVDRLLDTVDDNGPKGFDDKYGWGIVNPYRALTEETTYEGKDGDQVSSPKDRLSLDEQGKGPGETGDGDDQQSDSGDSALSPADSNSMILVLSIVATAVVLAAAVVVLVFARRHKAKLRRPTGGA